MRLLHCWAVLVTADAVLFNMELVLPDREGPLAMPESPELPLGSEQAAAAPAPAPAPAPTPAGGCRKDTLGAVGPLRVEVLLLPAPVDCAARLGSKGGMPGGGNAAADRCSASSRQNADAHRPPASAPPRATCSSPRSRSCCCCCCCCWSRSTILLVLTSRLANRNPIGVGIVVVVVVVVVVVLAIGGSTGTGTGTGLVVGLEEHLAPGWPA